MTNTITMPCEVAERIIRNIEIGNTLSAGIELRREVEAALEQPQDHREQHLEMVPAGWKLVPVEPTEAMLHAGDSAIENWGVDANGSSAYRAMLAAAPQPPVVEQAQVEQEPAPNGATHRQPKQGAFYKRVDGKWYVWSRIKNGESRRWYISPGTTESCLEPLYSHPQPAQQPLTDDQLFDVFEGKDSEIWWQFDFGRFQMVARAIERAHGIGGEA